MPEKITIKQAETEFMTYGAIVTFQGMNGYLVEVYDNEFNAIGSIRCHDKNSIKYAAAFQVSFYLEEKGNDVSGVIPVDKEKGRFDVYNDDFKFWYEIQIKIIKEQ